MKNVWKLSNYLFDWQWKKWNQKIMLTSGILAVFFLLGAAVPMGTPQSYEYYAKSFSSYDMVIDHSLLLPLFLVGLVLILVGLFVQIKGFSTNGKGIYTLFLLPMKRGEVYVSFLLSAGAAIAVYYLMWLILLTAAYFPIMSFYESKAAGEVFRMTKDNIITGLDVSQANGLFLAFQRSVFLGGFFPASFGRVLLVLGGLALIVTGIFFAGFYTEDVGLRVIGSIGAILGGCGIYLLKFWKHFELLMIGYSRLVTLRSSIVIGGIGLAAAIFLQCMILKKLPNRKDL